MPPFTGAMDFVEKFIWPGKDDYEEKDRTPLVDPETKQTETFVKAHGAFKYYWILRSGHSVSLTVCMHKCQGVSVTPYF